MYARAQVYSRLCIAIGVLPMIAANPLVERSEAFIHPNIVDSAIRPLVVPMFQAVVVQSIKDDRLESEKDLAEVFVQAARVMMGGDPNEWYDFRMARGEVLRRPSAFITLSQFRAPELHLDNNAGQAMIVRKPEPLPADDPAHSLSDRDLYAELWRGAREREWLVNSIDPASIILIRDPMRDGRVRDWRRPVRGMVSPMRPARITDENFGEVRQEIVERGGLVALRAEATLSDERKASLVLFLFLLDGSWHIGQIEMQMHDREPVTAFIMI